MLNQALIEESRRNTWRPFKDSPQVMALESQADVVGFGGAAGGGKSDLAIGAALTKHTWSVVYRRELAQVRDLFERAVSILDDAGVPYKPNRSIHAITFGEEGAKRRIHFGGVEHPDDWKKYKGRPRDLIAFDEATEFHESQVRILMGWLRTTLTYQRCRVIMGFNPPTDEDGRWVIRYFAPWIDEDYDGIKAAPGELRWFATINGSHDVECEGPEPFQAEDEDGKPIFRDDGQPEIIKPHSRTFIPATWKDNPFSVATGYDKTLSGLPEPYRSQLMYGDFAAAVADDPWSIVPGKWIRLSNKRWAKTLDDFGGHPPCLLSAIGMDVARGGSAFTCLAKRYGVWVGRLIEIAGAKTPDGPSAAAECAKAYEAGAYVNVDVGGPGGGAYDALVYPIPRGHGITAYPINAGAKALRADGTEYRDKSGKLKFANVRAMMYWMLREALDPNGTILLALPPDPELYKQLTATRYKIVGEAIQIEKKPEIEMRLGRSPDRAEALALSVMPRPNVKRAAAVGGKAGRTPDFMSSHSY